MDHQFALITGGASGIGAATGRLLANRGWKVVLADLDEELGRPMADSIGAAFLCCDHTDADACQKVVQRLTAEHGSLHLLYNNAGIGWTGTPEDCDPGEFGRIMRVNVQGPWNMTSACLPLLRETAARTKDGATLLFTASALGVRPRAGCLVYNTSKAAIIGMARSLAADLGPANIRVNAIAPGLVRTPASEVFTAGWSAESSDEIFSRYEREAPLGRIATVEDVANVAAFLASPEARAISSATAVVDCATIGM